jgi:hypothetical protein
VSESDKPTGSPRLERVTLAVGEHAPDLVDAAAGFARELQAELAALFVEDRTLLRVAALPITREIGRVSGVARAFDLPDLERMLRRQAEQLREQLAAMAQAASLTWSFEVRRGDLLEQALASLAPAQAVVLGHRAARAGTAPREPAPITALLDAADTELRALQVALKLAGDEPLRVLLSGAQPVHEARRAQVEHALAAGGARATVELAPQAALPRLARTRRSRIVVASGTILCADREALAALIDALAAPLILVG